MGKFNLNKKTEKAYSLAVKFFAEENLKNEEDLSRKVSLLFSLIAIGEGLYFWPYIPNKSAKVPMETIYFALESIKDKIGEKNWSDIQALHNLAKKEIINREDINQSKVHFKSLQKLA